MCRCDLTEKTDISNIVNKKKALILLSHNCQQVNVAGGGNVLIKYREFIVVMHRLVFTENYQHGIEI